MRLATTRYLYEDPHHPDRVTGTILSPPYTEEDRALVLALRHYDASLCDGCGQPKHEAWHSEMDGFYEGEMYVCHACTAIRGDGGPVPGGGRVVNTRPASKGPMPAFEIGTTTSVWDPPATS